MKKVIIAVVLHFVSININAQFSEKNALYSTGEIAFGNYLGMNLNLNYIINEKYSFQIGYSGNIREAKSQPPDFNSGLVGIFTLGFAQFHFDHMDNYQILVGKIYHLDERGHIRFNLAGGMGYTVITEPTNWEPVAGFTLGNNYTYDTDRHSTVSLIINPKIEFPFTRIVGLTISPMLQINKDRTFIGIGFGTMIGLLRKKTNQLQ